ncbi:MAG: hypothetical protein CVV02_05075 [Firmicutes bacterium HGW-Firmicutes-7]|nr:MAG: hypothetical protein CVV02_05075 [Firmicutes bacterium HGW-Firmicutes-7]
MYRMLVLDMDGTLLNERQKISKENIIAVKKAIKKGIKVVLATGRSFEGVLPYLKELDLVKEGNYSIACSGALALDNKTRQVFHGIRIQYEDLMKIHAMCEDFNLDMSAYTKESILIHRENLFSRYDAVANYAPLEKVDFHQLNPDRAVYKVNLINESMEIMEQMREYFPAIQLEGMYMRPKANFNKDLLGELWRFPKDIINNHTVVRPLTFCLEILNKKCNKAVGVKEVAKLYNISKEEIICIGDSGNDIHMIEYAGLGIAMGNAYEQVKEIADDITLTNQENGVAYAINKYL